MFEFTVRRSLLPLLILSFLGGCSGLATRMRETIVQADALDKMCEHIQSQSLDSADSNSGTLVWDRLKQRLELVKKDIAGLPTVNCPGLDTTKLSSIVGDLDKVIVDIGDTAKLPPFPICPKSGTPTNTTRQCARALLRYNDGVGAKLGTVATKVLSISNKLESLRIELGNQSSEAKKSTEVCAQRFAAWQGAVGNIYSGLGSLLTRNEAEVLEHYFASRFVTKMSERFIDRLERVVEPIDHLLDKLDDKTYVVSTVMMTLAHQDIQQQLDAAYREFLGRVDVPGSMRFTLARAACTRLDTAPAPGKRYSQVMPFLLEAFVKYGDDATDPLLGDVASTVVGMQASPSEGRGALAGKSDGGSQKPAVGAGGKQLVGLATYLANGLGPERSQQNPLDKEESSAKSIAAVGDVKDLARADMPVVADCTAASKDTLGGRVKCVRASVRETRATLGEADQFKIQAAAEFAARKALTQADGRIDEEMVKRSGQLALGESVLSYQTAYASALDTMKPTSIDLETVAGDTASTVTKDDRVQITAMQSIQYAVTNFHVSYSNSSVVNDNRMTIYRESNVNPSPPPKAPDDFCPALLRSSPSLRCLASKSGYVLDLDKPFPTRRWSDAAIYERLQSIATAARAMNKDFTVALEGFASSGMVEPASLKLSLQDVRDQVDLGTWPAKSLTGLPILRATCDGEMFFKEKPAISSCSEQRVLRDGNYLLALSRAAWAAQVLTRWGDGAIKVTSIRTMASSRAETGDLAQDRKVRIFITAPERR